MPNPTASPPAETPQRRRRLCHPLPDREGLLRVPIVPTSAYLPPVKQVVEHFQDFAKALQFNEELDYDGKQRAKAHAEAWYGRRELATGFKGLKAEFREPLLRLIRNQALVLGPRTPHAVDELFAAVHVEAPWFAEVSSFYVRHVRAALTAGRHGFCPPPVILVGRPGNGKSHYCRRLAQRLSLPARMIDVGGGSAGFRISGVERGWASAAAGIPVETIIASGVANPVMIVDEIAKARTFEITGTSQITSITTSLLQHLQKETAASFECPFYRMTFDLSHVAGIMTANSTANLPDPLKDRCRIFHIQPPTAIQLLSAFEKLTAGLPNDLRDIGQHIIRQRIKTVKGFNLRALRRLVETLQAKAEGQELH